MTDEHREQLEALIAALGEYEEAKFDASLTPPLPDRRNPRFESADIHRQRFDDNRTLTDTKRAVLKAAANARPALKALLARVAALESFVEDIAEADDDVWVTQEVVVENIGGYDRTEPVGVNYSQRARLLLGAAKEADDG